MKDVWEINEWIDDGSPATMRGVRARVRETDEGLAFFASSSAARFSAARATATMPVKRYARVRSFVRLCVVSRAGICVMRDLGERGKGRETDEKTDETCVAIF